MMIINAFLCLLITVRLFTFNRQDRRYKVGYAWLAWLMATSSSAVSMFSFFDLSSYSDAAQLVMNLALLICLLMVNGNVVHIPAQLKLRKKVK